MMGARNGVYGDVDVTSNTLSVSKVPKNYEESKSFYDDRYLKGYIAIEVVDEENPQETSDDYTI